MFEEITPEELKIRINALEKEVNFHKSAEKKLNERLQFEKMIADLSARFVNSPPDKVDQEIENGLKIIVTFFKLGRGNIYKFSEDNDTLYLRYTYVAPGLNPKPLNQLYRKELPYYFNRVIKGKLLCYAKIEDLPSMAVHEKEFNIRHGIKASMAFPLKIGGKVIGVFSLTSFDTERDWPEDLIQRIGLIAGIISNAITRKKGDRDLKKAFSEINQLRKQLQIDYTYLREEIKLEYNFDNIIGKSKSLKRVLKKVEQVSPTNTTVLVLGETGTGKELIVRAIHNASVRQHRPLIKVNCGTLPSELIESELFGYEKGAFTGAYAKKKGRFELAHNGTIFIDEIGELPLALQPKLLRVLQEGEFEKIGGTSTTKVDVRVIAATNRKIDLEAKKGRFRADLWYRLNVFPIYVPPLRERKEDIPLLVNYFTSKFCSELGKKIDRIPNHTMKTLAEYDWPGNIRELENVIERSVITSQSSTLTLSGKLKSSESEGLDTGKNMTLSEVEQAYISNVLESTFWKVEGKNGAAEILGLHPSTLRSRMRKLGLSRPDPANIKLRIN